MAYAGHDCNVIDQLDVACPSNDRVPIMKWEKYQRMFAPISKIPMPSLENFGRSLEVLCAFRPTQGERC